MCIYVRFINCNRYHERAPDGVANLLRPKPKKAESQAAEPEKPGAVAGIKAVATCFPEELCLKLGTTLCQAKEASDAAEIMADVTAVAGLDSCSCSLLVSRERPPFFNSVVCGFSGR